MTITTLSRLEFKQDVSRAEEAAKLGPVFITDNGQPAHVLLGIEEYRALSAGLCNIAELLAMPDGGDIEFEAPRAEKLYFPVEMCADDQESKALMALLAMGREEIKKGELVSADEVFARLKAK